MNELSETALLLVAHDWRTPAEDLAALAQAASPAICSAIAANPNTSRGTLTALSDRRRDGGIIANLIRNPNTSDETLLALLRGEFYPLVLVVTEYLSHHRNPIIRKAVASSSFTRREVLSALAATDVLSVVRTAAVEELNHRHAAAVKASK